MSSGFHVIIAWDRVFMEIEQYLEQFVGGSLWTDPAILTTSSLSCLVCMWAVTPEDGESPSFILTLLHGSLQKMGLKQQIFGWMKKPFDAICLQM